MSLVMQFAIVWLIGAVYSALWIWLLWDAEIVPPSDKDLCWILALAAICAY